MKRLFLISFFAGSALLLFFGLSACSAYQLGTGSKPGFRTIYVAPVVNETTDLPQSVALFTTQIREALARDGRVKLANSPGEAEAVLTVHIRQLKRIGTLSRPDDTGISRKFNIQISGYATLIQNGETLFKERPLQADVSVFTDNLRQTGRYDALLQSEYHAMPTLAENLAKAVKGMVLDTW